MKQRSPKKSETIEVRLSHETKAAFMARCRADGTSASVVLRRFIRRYLATGRAPVQPMRELAMILSNHPRRAAAGLVSVCAAGAAAMILAAPARAAVDPRAAAMFAWMDVDHDRAVTAAEFASAMEGAPPLDAVSIEITSKVPPPAIGESRAALFARIDANHDGRLSIAEFAAAASVRTLVSAGIAAADNDADGRITEAELAAYLTGRRATAGIANPGAGVGLMAHGIIAAADRDRRGAVTLAELERGPAAQ